MLIEDEIEIDSRIDVVWAISVDIDAWPQWNPTIQTAKRLDSGAFQVGSQARLKQPAQTSTVWSVTECTQGSCFVWETDGRLLSMRAKHLLTPVDDGVLCVVSVQLLGPLARLFGPLLKYPIKSALRRENQALRAKCEFHR